MAGQWNQLQFCRKERGARTIRINTNDSTAFKVTLSVLIGFSTLAAVVLPSTHYVRHAFGEVDNVQDSDYDEQTEYDNAGDAVPSDGNQGSEQIEDDRYEPDDYGSDSYLTQDFAVTDENSYVIVNILPNDQDYFGQEARLNLDYAYGSSYGTVIVNSDNTVTYIPSQLRVSSNNVVSDLFYYEASYDNGSSHYGGAVNVTIHQVNDSPIVSDSEYSVSNEDQFSFYLEGYDEEGDSLEYFIASFDGWGEYALNQETGMVTYIPLSTEIGEDVLFYGASDGSDTSNLAKIVIITTGGNGNSQSGGSSASGNEEEESPLEDDNDTTTGSGQNTNSTESNNNEPIADAGSDLEVFQGENVELDGSDSYDTDGDEIAYVWSQIAGPQITLANSDSATPTFMSPDGDSDMTLAFELVVSDGMSTSQPSSVTVLVIAPDSSPQPDESPTDPDCTDVLTIAGSSASGYELNHPPSHAVDSNPSTRWSENSIGAWIRIDLGDQVDICGVDITWYNGNTRSSDFIIAVSDDGTSFTDVFSDQSSGSTNSAESYTFLDTVPATYVRITVNGNTQNDYASITELVIKGLA